MTIKDVKKFNRLGYEWTDNYYVRIGGKLELFCRLDFFGGDGLRRMELPELRRMFPGLKIRDNGLSLKPGGSVFVR